MTSFAWANTTHIFFKTSKIVFTNIAVRVPYVLQKYFHEMCHIKPIILFTPYNHCTELPLVFINDQQAIELKSKMVL